MMAIIDQVRKIASEQPSVYHNNLMTVSMRATLDADSSVEIAGKREVEFSTVGGTGVAEWIITPTKTADQKMISWRLVALLKTEKFGVFESFVKSDHTYIGIPFSWAYFWRLLRDTKSIEGTYLLIAAALGYSVKYLKDKLIQKAPKPAPNTVSEDAE